MKKLLAGIAVAAAVLSSPPGSAENISISRPACSGGATFSCEDLYITSFDGITSLDATLYVPTATGPHPAILMTHGYGGWHRGDGDAATARFYAGKGYVVLAYTSRGFGLSGGTVELQSPDWEVRDAQRLITWLANDTEGAVLVDGQDDPRVGMVGGSYAGGIQLLTASYDDRLDAIAPEVTWNDLRYSLFPNGVIKHSWIDLLYPSGKWSGHLGPFPNPPVVVSTEGVSADQDRQVLTSYLANDNVEQPYPYSDGTGDSAEYLARRSPVWNDVIDDISTPTLLIQGQRDRLFWVNEAIANYLDIADNGTPAKLVVFSSGHGYSTPGGERTELNTRILTWFDRHLRDNLSADTGPPIEVWKPWEAPPSFLALSAFPSAAAVPVTPSEATLVNVVAPTSHSETTNFQGTTNSPSFDAAPGATAADLSVAVPAGTVIVGAPVLRFSVSATAPEAIVFAKLWDRDTSTGARSLVHHFVTPARVRGGDGDFCTKAMPGPATAEPVEDVAVCLTMAAITWRVEPGHELVLTLATSDTMYFGSRIPGVYKISGVSLALPAL